MHFSWRFNSRQGKHSSTMNPATSLFILFCVTCCAPRLEKSFCNSARGAESEDERLQEAESARACSLRLTVTAPAHSLRV
jgi:Na+-transporting methylmalonyl-CoA/oxaloacetate decarboxylase gamma subunit